MATTKHPRGKALYKAYEAKAIQARRDGVPMEILMDRDTEEGYAYFIKALPVGGLNYNPPTYEEVYAILEKAESEGKRVSVIEKESDPDIVDDDELILVLI